MPLRVLLLCLGLLALSASHVAGQPTTRVRRLQGSDRRGHFDLSWIELTGGVPNTAARARVNADLEREARNRLCRPEDGQAKYLSSELEMRVTYLDAALLSVATAEMVSCGGVHPNHIPTALLYDLRRGRRIELEAEMVRPTAFRRFVARRVAAAAVADEPHSPACDGEYEVSPLYGTGFIYLLSARALSATPDFPQVILACGFDVQIPWAQVAPFLKPASPLRSLVRTRANRASRGRR